MAKNPVITDEIKGLIGQFYLRHPNWKAKDIQKAVSNFVHRAEQYRKRYGDTPEKWPGLSAVQKVLAELHSKEASPEDKPWSIGTLVNHPIPVEALPVVMSFYKKRLAEGDVLTIREALWAARLFKIVGPPDLACDWALLYALQQQMIYEKHGVPFDSRQLDLEMIRNPLAARETQRQIAIWGIAGKYGADFVKLIDLNLSIKETEEIAKSGKYQKEGTT